MPAQGQTELMGPLRIRDMSDNVKSCLERHGGRRTLRQSDVDAIQSLGEDAYFVDGEFGLVDLTSACR